MAPTLQVPRSEGAIQRHTQPSATSQPFWSPQPNSLANPASVPKGISGGGGGRAGGAGGRHGRAWGRTERTRTGSNQEHHTAAACWAEKHTVLVTMDRNIILTVLAAAHSPFQQSPFSPIFIYSSGGREPPHSWLGFSAPPYFPPGNSLSLSSRKRHNRSSFQQVPKGQVNFCLEINVCEILQLFLSL